MKKLIILLTICCMAMTLCACGAPDVTSPAPTQETVTPVPKGITQFDASIQGITLEDSPETLLQKLSDLHLHLIRPNYENLDLTGINNPVLDGRRYNPDGSFSFSAGHHYNNSEMFFRFSAEGEMLAMGDDGYPIGTNEGLRRSASISTMESIYGKDYKKDVDGANVYQYYNGEVYLNVFYETDNGKGALAPWVHVSDWEFCRYPEINQD